jgi:hypothetical protein
VRCPCSAAHNNRLLLLCLGLGVALRTSGRQPAGAPAALDAVVVNVSLPALTLVAVQGLSPQPRIALAALTPSRLFAIGWADMRVPRVSAGLQLRLSRIRGRIPVRVLGQGLGLKPARSCVGSSGSTAGVPMMRLGWIQGRVDGCWCKTHPSLLAAAQIGCQARPAMRH